MRNFLLITVALWSLCTHAQQDALRDFRAVWYNVENYFDCVPDSTADDSEYLPGGIRGWNYSKYRQKQANIAKVISAIGGWGTPALVGLCEVESRKALTDLTGHSPLKSYGYRFIHHDSPDARGIDVALLYHPYQFMPITDEAIAIRFPDDTTRTTRDILYVAGTTLSDDTLHLFLCHFPSRSGGELESEPRRIVAASVLRGRVDSLLSIHMHPNILIMGDFNDYPDNHSITEHLQASRLPDSVNIRPDALYNLAYAIHAQGQGTYKHNGEWGMLDQMIVSGNLLDMNNGLFTRQEDMHLFDEDFLLETDDKYLGKRPFRTYYGAKYRKAFSDHLPLYLDLWHKEK